MYLGAVHFPMVTVVGAGMDLIPALQWGVEVSMAGSSLFMREILEMPFKRGTG